MFRSPGIDTGLELPKGVVVDDDIEEGMSVVAKCPFSIPKLHLKLSSSSPPTIHLSSPSSSPSCGVCTGVESVDVVPVLQSVGEDISKLKFGGERDPEGRGKEEVVGEAEVNVNTGGVSLGEDGVSVAEKLRVYPLGAA